MAAIAIVGAVAAFALTRTSDEPSAAGEAHTVTLDAAQRTTVTVFTPPPSTGTVTNTQDPAPAPPDTTPTPTPTPEPEQGRLIIGARYSFRIPAGWVTEASGVYNAARKPTENSFTRSKWRASGDGDVTIAIDYTTDFRGTVANAAGGVRDGYDKGPDFRERSFGPVTLGDGREVWRWQYVDGSAPDCVERVDYFMSGCDTGFALIGSAPARRFAQLEPLFEEAVTSLRPRC